MKVDEFKNEVIIENLTELKHSYNYIFHFSDFFFNFNH